MSKINYNSKFENRLEIGKGVNSKVLPQEYAPTISNNQLKQDQLACHDLVNPTVIMGKKVSNSKIS